MESNGKTGGVDEGKRKKGITKKFTKKRER